MKASPMWNPNEHDGPCVYQPYGSVSHPEHNAAGRLWGVCCVSLLTDIKGLTKDEAFAVLDALRTLKKS